MNVDWTASSDKSDDELEIEGWKFAYENWLGPSGVGGAFGMRLRKRKFCEVRVGLDAPVPALVGAMRIMAGDLGGFVNAEVQPEAASFRILAIWAGEQLGMEVPRVAVVQAWLQAVDTGNTNVVVRAGTKDSESVARDAANQWVLRLSQVWEAMRDSYSSDSSSTPAQSGMELGKYFAVLDLEPGASLEDMKRAYRELAMVWHPDRFPANSSLQTKAAEKMKEINEAYEALLASSTCWAHDRKIGG